MRKTEKVLKRLKRKVADWQEMYLDALEAFPAGDRHRVIYNACAGQLATVQSWIDLELENAKKSGSGT